MKKKTVKKPIAAFVNISIAPDKSIFPFSVGAEKQKCNKKMFVLPHNFRPSL